MGGLTVNSLSLGKVLKALVLVILCGVIAGIAGLLTMLLMFWMTHQNFAIDSHEKHGISHQHASRLGGVAVAFCAFVIYWVSVGLNFPIHRIGAELLSAPVFYAVAIGAIGLFDDALGHLSPKIRIAMTALIFIVFLLLNPGVVPNTLGIPGIDSLLQIRPLAFLLCVVACIGMLNATNMADGANGLMPLVFMGAFFGLFLLSQELVYFAVTMALMVFTLFNVLSGKLFLGDAGSYGLGALAALGVIKIISETGAEVWVFLCLASYPVIDFFVSVVRRKLAGRSPLSADSDHMHNRLYRFVKKFCKSSLAANSLSGLAISLLTTGVSVVLLTHWSTTSNNWIALFASQVIVYLMLYKLLPTNEPA